MVIKFLLLHAFWYHLIWLKERERERAYDLITSCTSTFHQLTEILSSFLSDYGPIPMMYPTRIPYHMTSSNVCPSFAPVQLNWVSRPSPSFPNIVLKIPANAFDIFSKYHNYHDHFLPIPPLALLLLLLHTVINVVFVDIQSFFAKMFFCRRKIKFRLDYNLYFERLSKK